MDDATSPGSQAPDRQRHGRADGAGLDEAHRVPPGTDDATVEALGTLSEALETVERARGHLYAFHQLSGTADLTLGRAVDELRDAGHAALADHVAEALLGRNVAPGRWTYQLVEEYDDGYWGPFRDVERRAREELVGGRRHLYEARLKLGRARHDRPGFELTPDDGQ